MTKEAYGAMIAGIDGGNRPNALKVTGAFDMTKLIKLCQTVQAYNFGMKPIIVGTAIGLMNVLPNSADGYRINTDSTDMRIELIRNVYGYDFLELPQVATGDYTNYGLALDDTKLAIISPAADKIVKGVVEGAVLTNSNDYYENADLTSNYTINKRFGFEFLSGAVSGEYSITG